ncbi:MAG: MmgE/PrpD family protein [Gammaproteobacteria bacterium]|nr:MmgE/PrpD family protein [Gammaproteobacteria bacterium]
MGNSLSIIDRLANFVCGLDLDRVPPAVVDEAKRCVLDTLGVIVAGQKTQVGRVTMEHSRQAYRDGDSHILGTGTSLHPMGAALVNAASGHAYDFDDTSYTGIMHGSVVVLPAALAMAEHRGAGGRILLEAFIIGVEVEYAIAEWCTTHLYYKGWWTSGVYGPLGAAAAASRVLGLDSPATANAMSIAISRSSGMKVSFGSDAKPLGIGVAACIGTESALLAAAGITGPNNVFEGKNGFLSLFNDDQHATDTGLQLGEQWRLTDPGILFKSFPVCSAAQAGAELTAKLLERHHLDSSEIVGVVCEVPPLVTISLVYSNPESIRQAQFSMQFAIGCILAHGDIKLDHLTEEVLTDPELQLQMEKVTMQVPDYLANDDTVHQRCPEGAGVTITTRSSEQFSDFLDRPTGMPGNPVSTPVLVEKFRDCLMHGGKSNGLAISIADEILEIDKCSDVRLVCEKLGE